MQHMNAERLSTDHRLPIAADLRPCAAERAGAFVSQAPRRLHYHNRFHASAAHARRRSWNKSHITVNAEGSEQ
jgi:hypothetical protein